MGPTSKKLTSGLAGCFRLQKYGIVFLFKLFNNRLGRNARTAHVGSKSRFCIFCILENSPLVDETFIHLFYSCDSVRLVHDRIATTVLGITENNKSMWFGYPIGELKTTFIVYFFKHSIFYLDSKTEQSSS